MTTHPPQFSAGDLLTQLLISSIAIPLFYVAGLMYGQRSHLVTAEYWRWWMVHLWVEGFFEVFATVAIAFLFTRLKLIEIRTATKAALFSTTIFLSDGIIGIFHHLYFSGATPAVIALGAIFSAFEVVPLTLVGYEAWENIRLAQPMQKAPWIANYKWPIYFFVSVVFWNLVGAGLFGFLINPAVGLLQAWASIQHGTWYARSAELMQSGTMQTLRWMRVPGDILFATGALLFAWLILGLLTGHSYDNRKPADLDTPLPSKSVEDELLVAGR